MESLLHSLKELHSAEGIRHIIATGGLFALIAIVFAETGLLAGFFLPGDSLLITAGIFASSDGMGGPAVFNVWILVLTLMVAAVVGDQVGYLLGTKTGHLVYARKDGFFFKRKHLDAAHSFYEKHGAKALILARFVPIMRTFVPFAAGMAQMNYRDFVRYNVLGGVLWVCSMIFMGYFLGMTPLANKIDKVIVVVIAVSLIPLVVSGFKAWRRNANS